MSDQERGCVEHATNMLTQNNVVLNPSPNSVPNGIGDDDSKIKHWLDSSTVSAGGKYSTQDERLPQISWSKIKAVLEDPLTDIYEKEKAPVIWFNNVGLRGEDKNKGGQKIVSFTGLWADVDTGNRDINDLASIIGKLGNFEMYVHTTDSSREGDMRYRLFLPLEKPCQQEEWLLAQEYILWLLNGDPCSLKAAQGAYLPIAKDTYKCIVNSGSPCSPLLVIEAALRDDEYQNHLESKEIERAKEEAAINLAKESKPPSRISDGSSPINEFNRLYSPQEVCEKAGYIFKNSSSAYHPNSQSKSFSLSFVDGICFSMSTSDPLYTGGKKGDPAHDAFGCFSVLFHGGNVTAAIKDAGDNWLKVNGESWNKVKQREHMQGKERESMGEFKDTILTSISGQTACGSLPISDEEARLLAMLDWESEDKRSHLSNVVAIRPDEERANVEAKDALAMAEVDVEGLDDYEAQYKRLSVLSCLKDTGVVMGSELADNAKAPDWLVGGFIEADSIGIIGGKSMMYKSFIALYIAHCIASGRPCFDKKVMRRGPVLYLAGEGGGGLGRRVRGLEKKYGKTHGLLVHANCGDLTDLTSMAKVVEVIKAVKPVLVIYDTFNQLFASVQNNDSSATSEAQKLVKSAALKSGVKTTSIIVHHEGKVAENGLEGSHTFLSNMDFVISVQPKAGENTERTVSCKKQKDSEEFPDFDVTATVVPLGFIDEHDGKEVTTLVIDKSVCWASAINLTLGAKPVGPPENTAKKETLRAFKSVHAKQAEVAGGNPDVLVKIEDVEAWMQHHSDKKYHGKYTKELVVEGVILSLNRGLYKMV